MRDELKYRAAEFFAGIGLMRLGLDRHGIEVCFANDIDPAKRAIYAENFDSEDFLLRDVRELRGADVPTVDLATASFPCIDLSLAGNRAGLDGRHSGTYWEFVRILEELGRRRPRVILLENVAGFLSTRRGRDFVEAIAALNRLGYWCAVIFTDAKWFVPQSRPRLFIVGALERFCDPTELAPPLAALREQYGLQLDEFILPAPRNAAATLAEAVERLAPEDPAWWDAARFAQFRASLQPLHRARLMRLANAQTCSWATAYRRTRDGAPVWEIRGDGIAGCLRTARGGSSKQALVEGGRGAMRARWMTPREYARLQGAPEFRFESVSRNTALGAFGDAVCVPVVEAIAKHCLLPILKGRALQDSAQCRLAI